MAENENPKVATLSAVEEGPNADVVDLLERWLAKAKEGKLQRVYLMGAEDSQHFGYVVAAQVGFGLKELILNLDQEVFEGRLELATYTVDVPSPPRPPKEEDGDGDT